MTIRKIKETSSNIVKHKNDDSKYAHFSRIDSSNYLLHPKLAFASPRKYVLNSGESLRIPAKWWHWVSTPVRTYSINFWFGEKIFTTPKKDIYMEKIDFSPLGPLEVFVWNTKNIDKIYKTTFRDFLKNNKENEYVITLADYNIFKSNKIIKETLREQIRLPNDLYEYKGRYDYNIWITSNKSDTGLHYDDDDGVICCLDGRKEIILYPPEDSKYLYPYKTRSWIKNDSLNFRYNSYTYIGYVEGLSSSRLLFELSKHEEGILDVIENFVRKNGKNKTIWGLKKENNDYRLEFYEYDLEKNPAIVSTDIFYDSPHVGRKKHYYHKFPNQKTELPFWGYGTYELDNKSYQESKIFVIDSYQNFQKNYYSHMNRLEYSEISDDFKKIILDGYDCYELCIFNKKPGQLFLMYLGISRRDFIEFLIRNNYSENLINHYYENNYNINNEITIVFDIYTKNIIRTGFYGIF